MTNSATAEPRSRRQAANAGGCMRYFLPVTLASEFVNISVSAGPAMIHNADTRPAVITVMRTHPGTSPRSRRR